MTILEHSSLAGTLKHAAGTSGGEWAGPCPKCGGDDRFRVWPDHPSGAAGGRFMCRGCGWQGDGIQFLRDQDGLGYHEACRILGKTPKCTGIKTARPVKWTPAASSGPSATWAAIAARFVANAAGQMALNSEGQAYAQSRGLTQKTVEVLNIGWNPKDYYDDLSTWGLPLEIKPETGKPRKVWLPAGLVIPTLRDGVVVAIKIRRSGWNDGDELPKYAATKGSNNAPMVLSADPGKPVVIVESELDAILCVQEAGNLCTAMAMRTAKGKPDHEAHDLLSAASVILVALDYDEAGALGWPWWRNQYRHAVRWPVPSGKDVGDLMVEPGLVRAWIEAGLPVKEEARPSPPARVSARVFVPISSPAVLPTLPSPASDASPLEALARFERNPVGVLEWSGRQKHGPAQHLLLRFAACIQAEARLGITKTEVAIV